MALLDLPIQELFSEFHYLAPFTVLLLCGVGLPLPEEVTLIGSGLLLYQGHVDFVAISLVCSAAILLGDSIPFLVGRRYGLGILQHRWVEKVLHPERFALLEWRFASYGNWAVFTCRFLPGIRIPGYFLAGSLRMSYTRFLLLDALGVAISVPTSIYLGKVFGGSVDRLRQHFADLHLVLAFGVVSLVLILLVRHRVQVIRNRAQARLLAREALAEGACEPAEAVEDRRRGPADRRGGGADGGMRSSAD